MSKRQTIKAIRLEIDRLNREIDLKIIKGLSYSEEAKRHRFLRCQLARLSGTRSFWFGRFGLISQLSF